MTTISDEEVKAWNSALDLFKQLKEGIAINLESIKKLDRRLTNLETQESNKEVNDCSHSIFALGTSSKCVYCGKTEEEILGKGEK